MLILNKLEDRLGFEDDWLNDELDEVLMDALLEEMNTFDEYFEDDFDLFFDEVIDKAILDLFYADEQGNFDEASKKRRPRFRKRKPRQIRGRIPPKGAVRNLARELPKRVAKLQARLTPEQRELANYLIREHQAVGGGNALHPRVAYQAALLANIERTRNSRSSGGADVILNNGTGLEIKTYAGNINNIGIDEQISKGLSQAGRGGQLWIQVNTPSAQRQQVINLIKQYLRRDRINSGQARRVVVYGPQGQFWYKGTVPVRENQADQLIDDLLDSMDKGSKDYGYLFQIFSL
jgi:hypothetical protein